MSEYVIRRGSVVESEFGIGPVVAITRQWIIHEESGIEFAVHREDNWYALVADGVEEDPGPVNEASY